MASGQEGCIYDDPNFAVICSFVSNYAKELEFPDISFNALKAYIGNTNKVHRLLEDILIRLLRKWRRGRCGVNEWEKMLVKFCYTYSNVDAWELERFGLARCKQDTKLRILKNLMEVQFDCHTKFKEKINSRNVDDLRILPIGRDKRGMAYWFFLDSDSNVRIYREEQDDTEASQSWKILVKDYAGLQSLITTLEEDKDKAISEDGSRCVTPLYNSGSLTPCLVNSRAGTPAIEVKEETKVNVKQEPVDSLVADNKSSLTSERAPLKMIIKREALGGDITKGQGSLDSEPTVKQEESKQHEVKKAEEGTSETKKQEDSDKENNTAHRNISPTPSAQPLAETDTSISVNKNQEIVAATKHPPVTTCEKVVRGVSPTELSDKLKNVAGHGKDVVLNPEEEGSLPANDKEEKVSVGLSDVVTNATHQEKDEKESTGGQTTQVEQKEKEEVVGKETTCKTKPRAISHSIADILAKKPTTVVESSSLVTKTREKVQEIGGKTENTTESGEKKPSLSEQEKPCESIDLFTAVQNNTDTLLKTKVTEPNLDQHNAMKSKDKTLLETPGDGVRISEEKDESQDTVGVTSVSSDNQEKEDDHGCQTTSKEKVESTTSDQGSESTKVTTDDRISKKTKPCVDSKTDDENKDKTAKIEDSACTNEVVNNSVAPKNQECSRDKVFAEPSILETSSKKYGEEKCENIDCLYSKDTQRYSPTNHTKARQKKRPQPHVQATSSVQGNETSQSSVAESLRDKIRKRKRGGHDSCESDTENTVETKPVTDKGSASVLEQRKHRGRSESELSDSSQSECETQDIDAPPTKRRRDKFLKKRKPAKPQEARESTSDSEEPEKKTRKSDEDTESETKSPEKPRKSPTSIRVRPSTKVKSKTGPPTSPEGETAQAKSPKQPSGEGTEYNEENKSNNLHNVCAKPDETENAENDKTLDNLESSKEQIQSSHQEKENSEPKNISDGTEKAEASNEDNNSNNKDTCPEISSESLPSASEKLEEVKQTEEENQEKKEEKITLCETTHKKRGKRKDELGKETTDLIPGELEAAKKKKSEVGDNVKAAVLSPKPEDNQNNEVVSCVHDADKNTDTTSEPKEVAEGQKARSVGRKGRGGPKKKRGKRREKVVQPEKDLEKVPPSEVEAPESKKKREDLHDGADTGTEDGDEFKGQGDQGQTEGQGDIEGRNEEVKDSSKATTVQGRRPKPKIEPVPVENLRRSSRANKGQRVLDPGTVVSVAEEISPRKKRSAAKTGQEPAASDKDEPEGKRERRSRTNQEKSGKKKRRGRTTEDEDGDYEAPVLTKMAAAGKRKGRRGRPKKNGDATSEEEEEDDIEEDLKYFEQYLEEEDSEPLKWASPSQTEYEFDSDGSEYQPKGRNAKRQAQLLKKENGTGVPDNDDTPCKRCGKYDQPQWILLCDDCDAGYHTACLRPPLMLIPDGDWFCPTCEHIRLIAALSAKLKALDSEWKRKDALDRRKQRLKYVGINLDNILQDDSAPKIARKKSKVIRSSNSETENEAQESTNQNEATGNSDSDVTDEDEGKWETLKEKAKRDKENRQANINNKYYYDWGTKFGEPGSTMTETSATECDSSSSGSETEEEYSMVANRSKRQRKQIKYNFEEFDDMIKSAIKSEDAFTEYRPNPRNRGKDISNLEEEYEREKAEKARLETSSGGIVQSIGKGERDWDGGEEEEKEKERESEGTEEEGDEEDEKKEGRRRDQPSPVLKKASAARRKGRRLTGLSDEDAEDDTDEYRASEDEPSASDNWSEEGSGDSLMASSRRRGGRKRSRRRRPVYDRMDDFVVDEYDSDEDRRNYRSSRPQRSARSSRKSGRSKTGSSRKGGRSRRKRYDFYDSEETASEEELSLDDDSSTEYSSGSYDSGPSKRRRGGKKERTKHSEKKKRRKRKKQNERSESQESDSGGRRKRKSSKRYQEDSDWSEEDNYAVGKRAATKRISYKQPVVSDSDVEPKKKKKGKMDVSNFVNASDGDENSGTDEYASNNESNEDSGPVKDRTPSSSKKSGGSDLKSSSKSEAKSHRPIAFSGTSSDENNRPNVGAKQTEKSFASTNDSPALNKEIEQGVVEPTKEKETDGSSDKTANVKRVGQKEQSHNVSGESPDILTSPEIGNNPVTYTFKAKHNGQQQQLAPRVRGADLGVGDNVLSSVSGGSEEIGGDEDDLSDIEDIVDYITQYS